MIRNPSSLAQIGEDDFFDPLLPVYRWRGDLPHWEQDGKLYFVTFRLGDSLPQEIVLLKQQMYSEMLGDNRCSEDIYLRVLKTTIDKYLDAGVGSCQLQDPLIREQVITTLHEADGRDYDLIDYVIMPNHLHIILRSAIGQSLRTIIGNIKRKSSYRINKISGENGSLWQSEYYDYLIRNVEELEVLEGYVRCNPSNLPESAYHLYLQS